MRSRRNVKKTKRHSRHRNRKMTRRVKTKRGGMRRAARAAAAAVSSPIVAARTSILHDVRPLFTQFNTTFGKNPTPEQKAVVLKGERYFRSGADIPVDGPLKASITKLIDEWKSTEQNAQKALDIYNKILQALEDAKEKRQKENINRTPGRGRDTFSSRSMYANSPSSLFLQGTSYGSQSSSSSLLSPFANTPQKLTKPHFNTPSNPNPTELNTPPGLSGYEKEAQSNIGNDDLTIQGTQLFPNPENATPLTSPFKSPPRLSSKSKSALGSPFSPSRLHPFRLG